MSEASEEAWKAIGVLSAEVKAMVGQMGAVDGRLRALERQRDREEWRDEELGPVAQRVRDLEAWRDAQVHRVQGIRWGVIFGAAAGSSGLTAMIVKMLE